LLFGYPNLLPVSSCLHRTAHAQMGMDNEMKSDVQGKPTNASSSSLASLCNVVSHTQARIQNTLIAHSNVEKGDT